MTPGDRLLYAMSARRELGWPTFKRTFDILGAPSLGDDERSDMSVTRFDTARMFDALGHVELEMGDAPRLYVTPPSLALLPVCGLPVAVLTGARSPAIIERLTTEVKKRGGTVELESWAQPDPLKRFPFRIAITAETIAELAELAGACGLSITTGPAGWGLLSFASGLADYLAQGQWTRGDRLNWEERYFSPELCRFGSSATGGEVELIRYVHPSRQYPVYYLFKGNDAMRVDPDWGRFAALENSGRNVLLYEPDAGRLLVPVTLPLPKLIARGLCLCSGSVPRNIPVSAVKGSWVPNVSGFKMYVDIPPDHATAAAQKLGQTLTTGFTFIGNDDD